MYAMDTTVRSRRRQAGGDQPTRMATARAAAIRRTSESRSRMMIAR